MFPEHMLSVRATVESGREAEFNRWYDSEHVPDAVRMLQIYDRDIGAFSTRTRTTYERVLVHPKT
jgi:hypothetical protein